MTEDAKSETDQSKNISWTNAKCSAIIDVWTDASGHAQLEGTRRNKQVYVKIAKEMKQRG